MIKFKHSGDKEANNMNICKHGGRQKVAARKACWYYFLPNSKRAVPIMPFYGHHRVLSDKPLVIVRSLASI